MYRSVLLVPFFFMYVARIHSTIPCPTNRCTVDVSTLLDATAIAAIPIASFHVVVVVAVTVALVNLVATRRFRCRRCRWRFRIQALALNECASHICVK